MFHTKVVDKIKTYFTLNNVFRNQCRSWDNVGK